MMFLQEQILREGVIPINCQIEFTNHCQLSCIECPHRLMQRPKAKMTDKIFDVVLNEYIVNLKNDEATLGYPPTVICHKDGEPLLHPKLKEYLSRIAAVKPNFRINLYTNGLLLTREFIDFLGTLPNKIWLFVSFHFYGYLGKKVDYTKTENLFRGVLNSSNPYSNIFFVFTSHVTRFIGADDLNMWAKIWQSQVPEGRLTIGINNSINPWTGLIDEPNCVKFDGCPYADFGHLFIGVTGNVIPCCMLLEEDIVFGNVMTDSRTMIYAKAEEFYSSLREKKNYPAICQKCIGVKNE